MDWKKIPSLAALRAFEATARHKSYTAAARELNVTDAALRQHVRKLEDFFNASLIMRRGHTIDTTQDGATLSRGLSEGFATIQAVAERLHRGKAERPVRVALPPSFAENWLIPHLPDFWSKHPHIEVDLSPSIKLVDLSQGNHDLAIRYGHGDWSEGNAHLIASADYTVVASPRLAKSDRIADLAQLKAAIWLFEDGREEHRHWASMHGIDFGSDKIRSYPNNSLVLSAARAGHGVSVQSWALVKTDVETGSLVAVYRQETPSLGYYLFYQNGLSPKAKCFASWLRDLAGSN